MTCACGCGASVSSGRTYVHGHNRRVDPTARFWSHVDKDGPTPPARPDLGPCWQWTGTTDDRGYGVLGVGRRQHRAHRFGYVEHVGPIPDDLPLDHLCRNHGCVNYESHLEIVTNRENTRRGVNHVAGYMAAEQCIHGHDFTPENTYVRPDGRGRQCRRCQVANEARHRRGRLGAQQ